MDENEIIEDAASSENPEANETIETDTVVSSDAPAQTEAEGSEDVESSDDDKSSKKKDKKKRFKSSDTVTVKKKEWEEVTGKCVEYLDTAKRIQAEFVNYKKRNENIRIESYNEGLAYALIGILPVLDNLERAITSMEDADEKHKQGVELILRQMRDALEKLGVEEIDNTEFDPQYHQAVMQVEAAEGQNSGDIANVLMKGYRVGDKVLRHSMVAVVA